MELSLKSIGYDAAATLLPPPLLSRLHTGQLAILTYHGVVEVPQPIPDPIMVPIDDFRRQMDFLREHYDVLPLDEAVSRCRDGRVKRPIVAITFDDGYEDNLRTGVGLLQQFGASATFFLTTRWLEAYGEYWWDTLERVLLLQPSIPASLPTWPPGQSIFSPDARCVRQSSVVPCELAKILFAAGRQLCPDWTRIAAK